MSPFTATEWQQPARRAPRHASLEALLGPAAWRRLPLAVRARFSEPSIATDYRGEFDVVRANGIGRWVSFACRMIGTPIVPRTGTRVPATIRVGPRANGVEWRREYRWPDGVCCTVRSTKVIGSDGVLVEKLPAGLCMPLDVYERRGSLHFLSRGYYFDWGYGAARIRVPLPTWLSPGRTHVEHTDESNGWFRFTMTVRHPLFGEMFFQTGRFRSAGE